MRGGSLTPVAMAWGRAGGCCPLSCSRWLARLLFDKEWSAVESMAIFGFGSGTSPQAAWYPTHPHFGRSLLKQAEKPTPRAKFEAYGMLMRVSVAVSRIHLSISLTVCGVLGPWEAAGEEDMSTAGW